MRFIEEPRDKELSEQLTFTDLKPGEVFIFSGNNAVKSPPQDRFYMKSRSGTWIQLSSGHIGIFNTCYGDEPVLRVSAALHYRILQ